MGSAFDYGRAEYNRCYQIMLNGCFAFHLERETHWLKPVSWRLAQTADECAGSFPSTPSACLSFRTAPPTVLRVSLVTWWGWCCSTRGKLMRSPGGRGHYASLPPPQFPVLRDLAWSGEYLLARARSGSLQVRLRGEEEEEGGGRRRRWEEEEEAPSRPPPPPTGLSL